MEENGNTNPQANPAVKSGNGSKLSFSMKIMLKIFVILLLSVLLLIPRMMIGNLIDEREGTANDAKQEISKKWGKAQCVAGPFLCIPARYDKEKKSTVADDLIIFPETFDISGNISSQVLHRGIYDVSVYSAPLAVKGSFCFPRELDMATLEKNYVPDKASYMFFIRDLRGLSSYVELTVAQEKKVMLTAERGYLSCEADMSHLLDGDTVDYSLSLDLKGSQGLYLVPCGNSSAAHITSNCPSPSFTGFLPDDRQVSDTGFTADWKVIALNRGFAQTISFSTFNNTTISHARNEYSEEDKLNDMDDFMGVSLKTGVNQYQQNTRANKYAYLIIILTFITVLFVEIRKENPIHLVQYLLIGIAIVLFYTLLLSFSEFMAFGWSYLIAAVMTIGLVTAYMAAILKIRKTAFAIGGLLSALYIYIYILLTLETFSLLAGSIGLFIILMLVMIGSQKINWYK